jgi:hypothetical protein
VSPEKGAAPPGTANAGSGGNPDNSDHPAPSASAAGDADEANIDYARRQTALALDHLRHEASKQKSPLLDRLGWSKDEANRFLARWEEMRKAAGKEGPAGETARRQFHDALKNLGLRPRGTELRHGGVAADRPGGLRTDHAGPAPPEWSDWLRAYSRGVADTNRRDDRP